MNKKKILIFLLIIVCLFTTNIKAESVFDISNIKITTNGDAKYNNLKYDKNNINLNVEFHKLNDSLNYEITIKNNTKDKYSVKNIYSNNKLDNISYDFKYDEVIKPNSNYSFIVNEKYIKNIDELDKKFTNNTIITIETDKEKINISITNPKTGNTKIIDKSSNPLTTDNIYSFVILFIVTLILIYLLIKNKKINKLFILIILFMPLITYAYSKYNINLNENIILYNFNYDDMKEYNLKVYLDNDLLQTFKGKKGDTITYSYPTKTYRIDFYDSGYYQYDKDGNRYYLYPIYANVLATGRTKNGGIVDNKNNTYTFNNSDDELYLTYNEYSEEIDLPRPYDDNGEQLELWAVDNVKNIRFERYNVPIKFKTNKDILLSSSNSYISTDNFMTPYCVNDKPDYDIKTNLKVVNHHIRYNNKDLRVDKIYFVKDEDTTDDNYINYIECSGYLYKVINYNDGSYKIEKVKDDIIEDNYIGYFRVNKSNDEYKKIDIKFIYNNYKTNEYKSNEFSFMSNGGYDYDQECYFDFNKDVVDEYY